MKSLRVAVLLDSMVVPAWARQALELAFDQPGVELVLTVVRGRDPRSASTLGRLWSNRRHLASALFDRIDVRLRGVSRSCFALEDARALLSRAHVITVSESGAVEAADLERIRSLDPEVIVSLGSVQPPSALAATAGCGVWSFHHGDVDLNPGDAPGFWEWLERWPVTGAALRALDPDTGTYRVLDRSWSMTDATSPLRNRERSFRTSVPMLARQLARLSQLGAQAFFDRLDDHDRDVSFCSARRLGPPTTAQALGALARYVTRLGSMAVARLFGRGQWFLSFDLGNGPRLYVQRFRPLYPPPDRFWADPHLLWRDGRYWAFVEEYPYRTAKGIISVLELSEQGELVSARPVIEAPYHLSYPFVFEYEGRLRMIPESAANGTVDLYRCISFPDKWEHERTLIQGLRAADATVVEHGGRWWMFAAVSSIEGQSLSDELHVFHADRPDSSAWTPHAANPVVTDCRRARPAGRLFAHRGRLYRPSQDSSGLYGRALNINHITKLTPTEYAETVASRITPDWAPGVQGVHTLTQAHRMTMIDVYRTRWRFDPRGSGRSRVPDEPPSA